MTLSPIKTRKSRSTGATVHLFDNRDGSYEEEGYEQPGPPAEGKWVTECETHGNYCLHESRRLATAFLSCPEEWCEDCAETFEAKPAEEKPATPKRALLDRVSDETIHVGVLLVPKQGRDLDPVIVLNHSKADGRACVRDAGLVTRDPRWAVNRCASQRAADGARWETFRELRRNYSVAGIVARDGSLEGTEVAR